MGWCGLDWFGSGLREVESFCECGIEAAMYHARLKLSAHNCSTNDRDFDTRRAAECR
jgi:hypothetical protein